MEFAVKQAYRYGLMVHATLLNKKEYHIESPFMVLEAFNQFVQQFEPDSTKLVLIDAYRKGRYNA